MENSADPQKPSDLDLHCFLKRIYSSSEEQGLSYSAESYRNLTCLFCRQCSLQIPNNYFVAFFGGLRVGYRGSYISAHVLLNLLKS